MSTNQSRLQVRTGAVENPWEDVGHGSGEQKLPVTASSTFNVNDLEEVSETVTYLGGESSSGVWYVQKIDETADFTFGHATVANNPTKETYTAAWAARADLAYSDFKDAF